MRSHRGQISFPGGRIDDGESEEDAALRELHEETGVDGKDVIVLGRMSDIYIPPSNSVVTPFLSIVQRPNSYRISEAEVQEIFDIPLMRFLDSSIRRSMKREMFETVVDVPYWHVHPDVPLWGATAMILNELVWLTKEYLGEERP
jgi:8-oxo-dGTP pyrophosphatase MutT (NUDIX family)